MPTVAAKIAVMPPTMVMTSSANGAYSSIGDKRHTMNTPAVTMVAAWISADTGVGPSIASGSHVCKPSCADFPIAPINSKMPATSRAGSDCPKNSILVVEIRLDCAKISSNWTDPNNAKTAKIPRANPKSPTRFTTKAFIAAACADSFLYQKPISKYEATPTPSHPKNN